ncbi:MAG: CDP-alcohol phosphatidyltransferase family protein [Synechococcaceae cyanobacterium]
MGRLQHPLHPAASTRLVADGLTVGRAVLGLPLILALGAGQAALAWWLLLLGGLSDGADGWLARRAGGGSTWGARLDPLTDKILIAAPLLWLGAQPAWPQQLPLWAVWLLLARELLVSGWRSGASGGGPASMAGKAKTVLQFTSLLLLLWPTGWPLAPALHPLGWWLFWPSLLLALSSARGYLIRPAAPRHR